MSERTDTERLDWLEQSMPHSGVGIIAPDRTAETWLVRLVKVPERDYHEAPTLRAALDLAMAGEGEGDG